MTLKPLSVTSERKHRRAPRLSELATVDEEAKCINVIIETPKGARTKLAYDPEREAFVVKKVLPQGMRFPFDFGFIPSTKGQDGDPLDVLVLMDESVPSGSIVPSRLIGVLEAKQTEKDGACERNDRLIAISQSCQLFAEVRKLADCRMLSSVRSNSSSSPTTSRKGRNSRSKDATAASAPRTF